MHFPQFASVWSLRIVHICLWLRPQVAPMKVCEQKFPINLLATDFFFQILAHPVFKM